MIGNADIWFFKDSEEGEEDPIIEDLDKESSFAFLYHQSIPRPLVAKPVENWGSWNINTLSYRNFANVQI